MTVCPQCGAELQAGDPAGLCPKCLIQGAFDSSVGAGESGTQTIDTAGAAAGDDDFGRYHILRTLGEGGMGTVYLAEQREPIRRSVALKVIKLGMDTGQVLARFANERQALAMMDPNRRSRDRISPQARDPPACRVFRARRSGLLRAARARHDRGRCHTPPQSEWTLPRAYPANRNW